MASTQDLSHGTTGSIRSEVNICIQPIPRKETVVSKTWPDEVSATEMNSSTVGILILSSAGSATWPHGNMPKLAFSSEIKQDHPVSLLISNTSRITHWLMVMSIYGSSSV